MKILTSAKQEEVLNFLAKTVTFAVDGMSAGEFCETIDELVNIATIVGGETAVNRLCDKIKIRMMERSRR